MTLSTVRAVRGVAGQSRPHGAPTGGTEAQCLHGERHGKRSIYLYNGKLRGRSDVRGCKLDRNRPARCVLRKGGLRR